MQYFFNGLLTSTQVLCDNAAGGSFSCKSTEDAWALLKKLVKSDYNIMGSERSNPPNNGMLDLGVRTVEAFLAQNTHLKQQNEALSKMKVNAMNENVMMSCAFCQGNHNSASCLGGDFSQEPMDTCHNFHDTVPKLWNDIRGVRITTTSTLIIWGGGIILISQGATFTTLGNNNKDIILEIQTIINKLFLGQMNCKSHMGSNLRSWP